MKNGISKKDLEELKQQKKQFKIEQESFLEDVYEHDKGLSYYSQITLDKFYNLLKFCEKKLQKEDFEKFSNLLTEQNKALFEEYGRLNYLYYELGKKH